MKLPERPRVVVTGAGSGLGRAFCEVLAERKARILLSDISLESAKETQAMIEEMGAMAEVLVCDVSQQDQVEALATKAVALWGGVDLVINNAGVAVAGAMEEISLEDWDWIIGVNLMGVIHGCRSFIPIFKSQKAGAILNVASAAGFVSNPDMSAYNVTKSGVVALSETLFGELRPFGVQVSVLCPSFFPTKIMSDGRVTDESLRKFGELAMKRSKWTAVAIAKNAINGLEKEKLFVIPQQDAKWMWRMKRFFPETLYKKLSKAYPKIRAKLEKKVLS